MSEAAFKKKNQQKTTNQTKNLKTLLGCKRIALKLRRLKTKVRVVSASVRVVVVCQEGEGPR